MVLRLSIRDRIRVRARILFSRSSVAARTGRSLEREREREDHRRKGKKTKLGDDGRSFVIADHPGRKEGRTVVLVRATVRERKDEGRSAVVAGGSGAGGGRGTAAPRQPLGERSLLIHRSWSVVRGRQRKKVMTTSVNWSVIISGTVSVSSLHLFERRRQLSMYMAFDE